MNLANQYGRRFKFFTVFRFQGSKVVLSNECYLGILIGNGAIHIIYG